MTNLEVSLLIQYDRRGGNLQKVISTKKETVFSFLQIQDIYCGICALCIGFIQSPLAICFVLPYLSYVYMRKTRECVISTVIILLCTLQNGIMTSYVYALCISVFFLCIHSLRLLEKNIYRCIPYVATLISIPYALFTYQLRGESVLLVVITMVLSFQLHKDYKWLQSSFLIDPIIYTSLLFALLSILDMVTGGRYALPIYGGGFLLIALINDLKVTVVLSIGVLILHPLVELQSVCMLVLFLIGLSKDDKKLCVMLLLASLLIFPTTPYQVIYTITACFIVCLYKDSYVPWLRGEASVQSGISSTPQSLLKRQMNNFSSIFGSLAQYYENVSGIEAEMLSNMAKALKFSADEVKKLTGNETVREKVMNALEGYQYDVTYFMMEEIKEGSLHIELDIKNIKKNEIKQTLLPLLEVLLHTRLQVCDVKYLRFSNGYHHIVFETLVPYEIHSYAHSIQKPYAVSGDSYSIFRFRQSTICMISDGMGTGEKAANSSRLITNIFQRMIISGIPQIESIKCINKLLQSDSYATLDVLCFDQSQGVVYISKSAACPTYLIRNDKLYEINGNSLPVGIVSQMEPDCFLIDLKEGDEYLMVSDGVYVDEIETWMKTRNHGKVKDDVKEFVEYLKQNQRDDDTTVLLAQVHKVNNLQS